MALSFVGAGSTGVAKFDTVAMCPTVAIRIKSDFWASGRGTGRRLRQGWWWFVSKQGVSRGEGCDTRVRCAIVVVRDALVSTS
jgi:hypothetical protein